MRKIIAAMAFLSSVSFSQAGQKEEAYQVVEKWSKAFSDSDAAAVARLYAPEALMIGTLGKVVLTTPDQIFEYFNTNLNTDKPRTAKLNTYEALVVDDRTVVIAGFDTITRVKDGQTISSMGRVTFVLSKQGADWKIVHLHRSPFPAT